MVNVMPSSIITYKELKENMRFDAEYYHPEKSLAEKKLNKFTSSIEDNFEIKKKTKLPKTDELVLLLDLDNIFENRIINVNELKGWEVGSSKKIIIKNDILISRLRSYLKQVAINYNSERIYGSTELIILRKKPESKIKTEILFAFLLSKQVQIILKWSQEGTNHPRFSPKLLQKLNIPIPSEDTQNKIKDQIIKSNKCFLLATEKYKKAEKIIKEELELDKLKTRNDCTAIINHSDYLSASRIDAQFFSSKHLNLKFLNQFDTKSLKILCNNIETGLTPSKDSYWNKGYPVLKMGYLTNFGIDWSKIEYANETYFNKFKKDHVKKEDIFLTSSAHAREHIAKKVDIIIDLPKDGKNNLVFVGEILRIRVKKNLINPYYLLLFLRTEIGYKLLQNCIRGQTAHIYSKDVEKIIIPIISRNKQEEIENLIHQYHNLLKESSRLILESISEVENMII